MNKICTNIEQSKKLMELGIDANTADMCHRYRWSNNSFMNLPCAEKAREPITGDIPAWSLTALLGLIPNWTMDKTDKVNLTCNSYYHCESCYQDIVDATFEMICWLKENGKI